MSISPTRLERIFEQARVSMIRGLIRSYPHVGIYTQVFQPDTQETLDDGFYGSSQGRSYKEQPDFEERYIYRGLFSEAFPYLQNGDILDSLMEGGDFSAYLSPEQRVPERLSLLKIFFRDSTTDYFVKEVRAYPPNADQRLMVKLVLEPSVGGQYQAIDSIE